MNLHYQVHEDDFKICPYCGKKFQMESSLFSTHKIRCLRKRDEVKIIYNCRYCEKEYKDPTSRRDHERIVHTDEVSSFFYFPTYLLLNSILPQKPHICQICNQSFHTRIILRRHIFKHGIGATCHCECGKAFLQRYELTRHQKYCTKNPT